MTLLIVRSTMSISTNLCLCLGKLGMIWQNKLYKKRIKRFAADTENQAHI